MAGFVGILVILLCSGGALLVWYFTLDRLVRNMLLLLTRHLFYMIMNANIKKMTKYANIRLSIFIPKYSSNRIINAIRFLCCCPDDEDTYEYEEGNYL